MSHREAIRRVVSRPVLSLSGQLDGASQHRYGQLRLHNALANIEARPRGGRRRLSRCYTGCASIPMGNVAKACATRTGRSEVGGAEYPFLPGLVTLESGREKPWRNEGSKEQRGHAADHESEEQVEPPEPGGCEDQGKRGKTPHQSAPHPWCSDAQGLPAGWAFKPERAPADNSCTADGAGCASAHRGASPQFFQPNGQKG
jgi:hypothetical protein